MEARGTPSVQGTTLPVTRWNGRRGERPTAAAAGRRSARKCHEVHARPRDVLGVRERAPAAPGAPERPLVALPLASDERDAPRAGRAEGSKSSRLALRNPQNSVITSNAR
ncbi:hypothetical protein ABZP36_008201 [Zizania latifolia]